MNKEMAADILSSATALTNSMKTSAGSDSNDTNNTANEKTERWKLWGAEPVHKEGKGLDIRMPCKDGNRSKFMYICIF